MNETMDDLFLSLGTSILTYESTNSFESIVNDFNALQSEWLKQKLNNESKLTVVK
jgi:hypothetical protein